MKETKNWEDKEILIQRLEELLNLWSSNNYEDRTPTEIIAIFIQEVISDTKKECDVVTAFEIVHKFNQLPFADIDWDEYFQGTSKEIERMINEFKFTGLNNMDLLTSDFYTKFRIKSKVKINY